MLLDLFSLPFDFSHVDGFGRACQRGIEPKLNGQTFRADALGPIVEFGNLAAIDDYHALRSKSWFDDASRHQLFDTLGEGRDCWVNTQGTCGFARRNGLCCNQKLTSFKIDAHKAALAANFGRLGAPRLISAMGELIGNIIDHSEAENTGFAAFSVEKDIFEFVVADRGVGALQSLRRFSAYEGLRDDGAALLSMIEPGVSRFGPHAGHGNGFRPIFEKLAAMTGQLRFRSGDFVLTVDGRFGDKINRQVSQKPRIRGLLASVVCKTTGNHSQQMQ